MFPADVVPSQTHMALPSVAHVSSWKMTSPQRGFNTPYFTALTCGASEDKWFHWNKAVVGPCAPKGARVGVKQDSDDLEPGDKVEATRRLASPGGAPGLDGLIPHA